MRLGQSPTTSRRLLLFELIDEIDKIEETAPGP